MSLGSKTRPLPSVHNDAVFAGTNRAPYEAGDRTWLYHAAGLAYAEALCKSQARREFLGIFPLLQSVGHPIVFLAPQSERQTATVTFPSKKPRKRNWESPPGWSVDDDFRGLTVLHAAPEPHLDICAVHGLNGNAFDTFAWEGRQMWLKDFLPLQPQFKQSRIMTYGYSSLLTDNVNTSGVAEWASGLLREISSARVSPAREKERSRPIVFVCHSLGGLVVREAMVELSREAQLYDGLDPKCCGLLFLATPHSGSLSAIWNGYLVQLAQLTGLRARDFIQILGAFNNSSRMSKRDFGRLEPPIPFECLYETRKMKAGGWKDIIVTADAAGLNSVTAQPMSDVDHTSICRFPHQTHPGYAQILACLMRIQDRILKSNAGTDKVPRHDAPQLALTETSPVNDVMVSNAAPAPSFPVHPRTEPRPSNNHSIKGGDGIGGAIGWDGTELVVGGGYASGASIGLCDLGNFPIAMKGGHWTGCSCFGIYDLSTQTRVSL
ncbi:hypothetical protein NUW58_g2706 [Xylaria curta]|uniref:Uncharacterized protein n=1 Tax=Xylaria curta TaxID=42375 RepID=A0ACC1PH00_9PEZI|nr:hypothetical protein NUW58_g2706 [Xylaria curta]